VHTHAHTQILQLTGFSQGRPRWAIPEETFTTHTYRGHQSSLIYFLYVLQSMASSLFNLRAWKSLFTISLQASPIHLPAWHHQLHTPYISSPNHCLPFATHAHTVATCFAVVPRLCELIPVSLSQPITQNSTCSPMPHIHLTTPISARRSATSFSHILAVKCFTRPICKIIKQNDNKLPCTKHWPVFYQ